MCGTCAIRRGTAIPLFSRASGPFRFTTPAYPCARRSRFLAPQKYAGVVTQAICYVVTTAWRLWSDCLCIVFLLHKNMYRVTHSFHSKLFYSPKLYQYHSLQEWPTKHYPYAQTAWSLSLNLVPYINPAVTTYYTKNTARCKPRFSCAAFCCIKVQQKDALPSWYLVTAGQVCKKVVNINCNFAEFKVLEFPVYHGLIAK